MKAGVRANLDAQSISTILKRDVRRGVLEYVKNQQLFTKAYAKEGVAYVLSWKEGTGTDPATPAAGANQSCGFTTPVLKHRIRPALEEKSQVEARRPKEVAASPRETDASSKPTDRAANLKKRGPPHQGARGSKRKRALQLEEEKRLQERREKKRIKRDIMRPERPKRQEDTHSPSKPNSKKTKQRLPAGLALMHGFTATNVGKNRLTVDPPFRSGVFSKGKASLQAQVGKSRPRDSRMNRAFSEEQFLKSNGRYRSNSMHICSSVSLSSEEVSSGPIDDLKHQRRNFETDLSDNVSTCREKEPKPAKNQQKEGQKHQQARTGHSRQPSEEARSIVWDIEKDNGVLPSDSSSVQGPKPSTVLLDVVQKKWITHNKEDPVLNEGESPNNSNDAEHASDPIGSQRPTSVVSSVGPSKSASQIVPALDTDTRDPEEGVSKYFMLPRPPTAGPLDPSGHKSECRRPNPQGNTLVSPAEADAVTLSTLDHIQQPSVFVELEEPTRMISLVGQDIAPCPQDIIDSDWLLSDSIPDDPPFGNKEGGWHPLAGQLEAQCVQDLDLSGDGVFCPLQEPNIYEDYLHSEEEEVSYTHFGNAAMTVQHENHFSQDQFPLNDDTENIGTDDLSEDDALVPGTSPGSLEPSELDCVSERFVDEESPPLFNEGRYLLLGCRNGPTPAHLPQSDLKAIEADVAQHLVSHWMPQRY